jgi:uncharacterized SAM-binding protein YcdF (DUF218 family)
MDSVFFIASKLVSALIRPDTWIVLAVGFIAFALFRGRWRLARNLSLAAFVVLVVVATLPFGDLAMRSIESRYPANPALQTLDGIVILGGAEDAGATTLWDQVQLNEGAERYTAALSLARRFPEAKVLFAGGSGALRDMAGGSMSEADVAARFFREQGLDPGRMMFESRSRNTAENSRLSLDIANPKPGSIWVLVTSAYHMPRAMGSFERAGWTALVAYPVDYRSTSFAEGIGWNPAGNLLRLKLVIKEWVGNLVYWATGR